MSLYVNNIISLNTRYFEKLVKDGRQILRTKDKAMFFFFFVGPIG